MKLKAWITDAPAGGVAMQILEQEGVKPELLTSGVQADDFPYIGEDGVDLPLILQEKHICEQRLRTAQSVIDQLTAGLAGHAETREPKRGDWVEVRHSDFHEFENRLFWGIADGARNKHLCTTSASPRMDLPNVHGWEYMRPIPQPVRYSKTGDIHTWTTEAEKAGEGE